MANTGPDKQRIPQFSVGDLVSQKGVAPNRVGTVVKIYDFNGERRVVVRFEDGSESVFFDFELVAEQARPSSASE